jgi:hypothetical protein
MSNDTERSVASAGSQLDCLSAYLQWRDEKIASGDCDVNPFMVWNAGVRHAAERLRLTDAEREAIDDAAEDAEIEADHRRREGEKVWASHYDDKARSLRAIIERLK